MKAGTFDAGRMARPWAALGLIFCVAGCGGGTPAKTANAKFFTSGDKQADQRAAQRMAASNQLAGQKTADKPKLANDNQPLYERLGGEKGIKTITEDFVTRALADPRVNWRRQGVTMGGFTIHRGRSEEWNASEENVRALQTHVEEFLALATGGPAVYHGKEMRAAHQNMHITNAEFDAAVGDLKASLDKAQIPNKEQKELLSIAESTRPEIVEER